MRGEREESRGEKREREEELVDLLYSVILLLVTGKYLRTDYRQMYCKYFFVK